MASIIVSALAFNQPIGSWNFRSVTTMDLMFCEAKAFNQFIGSWNVTTMSQIFHDVTAFNKPIGAWDVSNVTNMSSMFDQATTFNQPIGARNVGKRDGCEFYVSLCRCLQSTYSPTLQKKQTLPQTQSACIVAPRFFC